MIAVVDYKKGNLKSVERGLICAGGDARITDNAKTIAGAHAIVLPGVGAFADAAATMNELGQMDVVRSAIDRGVPFLGICIGFQLMFEEGVEGAPQEDDETSSHNACGLAILPGVVTKLPRKDAAGTAYKIPHVGWNSIEPYHQASIYGSAQEGQTDVSFACPLLANIAAGEYFYFTHSYIAPDTPATKAYTQHSVAFPSVVQFRETAFGVQFHPEKSSDAGAVVLRNFVEFAKRA